MAENIEEETKGMVVMMNKEEVNMWIFDTDVERSFYGWPKGDFAFHIDLKALNFGDILQVDKKRKIITATEGIGAKYIRSTSENSRDRIEVPIFFVPLAYSLYPSTAKKKNLVKAYTNKLGYVPITNENRYQKHTIYQGNAIYYLDKKESEKKIAKIYSTGWFISNNGNLAGLQIVQENFTFFDGLILDSSLTDAFMIFNENSGLVALRKDICVEQQIGIGDWIRFILLVVDEAEKADENKQIFPDQEDEMTFFQNRHIAIHPIKMTNPYYETKAINDKQVQINYELDVPMNPIHKGTYQLPHLGQFTDAKGLIGLQHQGSKIKIEIFSRIINYHSVQFNLAKIPLPEIEREPVIKKQSEQKNTMTFLEGIERRGPMGGRTRKTLEMLVNGRKQTDQPPQQQQQQTLPQPLQTTSNQQCQQQPAIEHWPNEKMKRPSNSIFVQGLVVELVINNNTRRTNGNDSYVLAFSNDMALNTKMIRLMRDDIEPIPKLGEWLNIIMKKKNPKNTRNSDWTVSSAEKCEPPFETTVGANSNVKVRVKLRVNEDGTLFNSFLGKVNNINRRINVPEGYERQSVMAWCVKIKAENLDEYRILDAHWEISDVPDAQWVENESPKTNRNQKGVERGVERLQSSIGYIGSRYRKNEGLDNPDNNDQTPNVRIHLPTVQNHFLSERISPSKESVVLQLEKSRVPVDTRGQNAISTQMQSSIQSAQIGDEIDLIDLHSDNWENDEPMHDSSKDTMNAESEKVYQFVGFIASHVKEKGYYLYTNQLDKEVFMANRIVEPGIERGTWIKFNIEYDQDGRSIVCGYEKMQHSPFVVKEERNSVCMIVNANIPEDYDTNRRMIATEYVPMVYDINRVICRSHLGKTVSLRIKRHRLDYLGLPNWHIERLV